MTKSNITSPSDSTHNSRQINSVNSMQNIGGKMAKGAAWMVAFKLLEKSICLVSTFVLARLLIPADFGLVSIANAFLALLLLLTSFNFDVALIQNQNATRKLYDTAWTFNVLFGLMLAVILTVSAPILTDYYNEDRLEKILYILATGTFLSGFSNIGPVAFRKDLQFHKEFYFLLTKKIIAFTVCMSLAFTLRNYWALVIGTLAGQVMEILLSYLVHPYRPRFCVSERKDLFGVSIWLFLNNMIFFIYQRIPDFIISKFFGSHSLGVYNIAYEISNLPTTELVAPINRAVLPGYSKLAGDLDQLRKSFIGVLSMIILCAAPAGAGIAVISDSLVMVFLGDKWLETIDIIRILAVSGAITAVQTNFNYVYIAIGKPRFITIIAFLHVAVIFIPTMLYLINIHGLIGFAEAYLVSNLIILPVNYLLTFRVLKLGILPMLSIVWRPLLSCAVMVTAILSFTEKAAEFDLTNHVALLACQVGIGGAVYALFILFFWILCRKPDGAEKFIVGKIFK